MGNRDEDFLATLRATFKVEAAEHLHVIATGLLQLEKSPPPDIQRELVATVFRAAHSLKGAARAVDFSDVEGHCQTLEDTFASWKRQERAASADELDALHRTLNAITAILSAAPASSRPPERWAPAGAEPPAATGGAEASSAGDTVRIPVVKLDAQLMKTEEMLAAKLIAGERAEALRELAVRCERWRNAWMAIEPESRALRHLAPGSARLWEFLDRQFDEVKAVEGSALALARSVEQDRHVIGKLVDDLLEGSKQLLLLPFATLAAPFPKLVRDLSRDQGKEIDLLIRGEDVELDKRVLEEMKDPLVHLLRNCIAHGIEAPELRLRLGKPARGSITLAASPVDGSKVELLITDDGAGIDLDRVKASAVRHGLTSAEGALQMSEPEAQALIFRAEVSTSAVVTPLSGRGLGLAIVREKAERLGGAVSVESQRGGGTRFRIVLPALLATFRGILIEAAGRQFVVPTARVERVARVQNGDVKTVEGRETISLGGRLLSWVSLPDVLGLPCTPSGEAPAAHAVLIIGTGDQAIAFAVDAILQEQEVLVKRLGRPLSRVRHIAGATVLGSGRVVPILNATDLLKSARSEAGLARPVTPAKPKPAGAILVAEDSITSRTLIKSILESAGYQVRTAVDGMEAFAFLRESRFDLLVSDVEMPRLNGFDLTARIRADRRLAELPVVLVSARETREDRERGAEVGANAYLVKSNFDQSDLLAAVGRLL